jgi:hypothetical protein
MAKKPIVNKCVRVITSNADLAPRLETNPKTNNPAIMPKIGAVTKNFSGIRSGGA